MNLYVDIGSNKIVSSPFLATPPVVELSRGMMYSIVVAFLNGGAQIELAGNPSGVLMFKESGKFDGAAVLSASPWVKSGSGASTFYTFGLSTSTAELNTLLGHDGLGGDVTNDIEFIDLDGSIQYGTTKTLPSRFRVFNDVIKGGEISPNPYNENIAMNLNNLTGGSSMDLDGVDISGFPAGQLLHVRRGTGIGAQVDLFSLEPGDFTENTLPTAGPIIVNVDALPDAWSWIQKG